MLYLVQCEFHCAPKRRTWFMELRLRDNISNIKEVLGYVPCHFLICGFLNQVELRLISWYQPDINLISIRLIRRINTLFDTFSVSVLNTYILFEISVKKWTRPFSMHLTLSILLFNIIIYHIVNKMSEKKQKIEVLTVPLFSTATWCFQMHFQGLNFFPSQKIAI